MQKLEQLYEGKAKKVYKTDKDNAYIVSYKDDATAFNGEKKGSIAEKGKVNNLMSAILFEALEKQGIQTHLIEVLNERETLVKAVEIVPVEVIVRNIAAGSLSKRLGIPEGTILSRPVLEFCLKDDTLGDPIMNEDHIDVMGLATEEEIQRIKNDTLKINDFLQKFFLEKGLKLVDFKLEFGRYGDKIILADEISPDTCRLWDVTTNKKMDKDRFRRDLGDIEETYQEVLARIK